VKALLQAHLRRGGLALSYCKHSHAAIIAPAKAEVTYLAITRYNETMWTTWRVLSRRVARSTFCQGGKFSPEKSQKRTKLLHKGPKKANDFSNFDSNYKVI